MEPIKSKDFFFFFCRHVEAGEWGKALDTASQHSPQLLHKYLAQLATVHIRQAEPLQALALFKQHGAPAMPQNYNIYRCAEIEYSSMKGHIPSRNSKIR